MGDPYGNLSGGDVATAYSVYQTGKRMMPFVQGTMDSVNSATTALPLARAAGGMAVKRAATQGGVELAEGALVKKAIGGTAASLAAEGVMGAGAARAVGALAGPWGMAAAIAAPLVMEHMPMGVRKAVNSIPLLGSTLSPIHKKPSSGGGGSGYVAPSPFTQTGAEYSMNQRARYTAGRGYR